MNEKKVRLRSMNLNAALVFQTLPSILKGF